MIRYVSDNDYNDYIKSNVHTPVTQSLSWSILQENVPNRGKTYRFVVEEDANIKGSCVIVVHKLDVTDVVGNNIVMKKLFKGKTYLYAHRGPIFDAPKVFDSILDECKKIAKQEKAIFIRFDPVILLSDKKEYFSLCSDEEILRNRIRWNDFFINKDFIIAHDQYQPMSTLILDIDRSEEDILKNMSQTGRRNIRKSDQANLAFGYTTDIHSDVFDQFINIMDETTKRDGFLGHNRSYYERIVDLLGKENICRLYYAKSKEDNKILASFIVTYFGDTATYYYGASSNEQRDKMAPFGLHWYVIRDMKAIGCKYYDFLGVAPFYYFSGNVWKVNDEYGEHVFDDETMAKNYVENEHKFCKITLNKTRFGGFRADYPPAYEYIMDKIFYKILINIKKLRKVVRKIGIKI